jgi:hypothetical protein
MTPTQLLRLSATQINETCPPLSRLFTEDAYRPLSVACNFYRR